MALASPRQPPSKTRKKLRLHPFERPQLHLQDEPALGGDWVPCTCTFCGPVQEDGSRRCAIEVDPIVWGLTGGHLLCADCTDSCLLRRRRRRRAAVKAARTKRKRLEEQEAAEEESKRSAGGAASGAPGAASGAPAASQEQAAEAAPQEQAAACLPKLCEICEM